MATSACVARSLNAAAPAPLRILLDGIDRLGRLDGWIGGGCLLTLTLLMLAEVATRFLSNFLPFFPPTISIAWEYSSYLMAASFTFGAAMTLRVGGHIRVVLLLKNVPAAGAACARGACRVGRLRLHGVPDLVDGRSSPGAPSSAARSRRRATRRCGFRRRSSPSACCC